MNWSAEQDKAFHKSKDVPTSSTLLVHNDSTKKIGLECDASPYGIGAVISLIMEDSEEKPIAYTSHTLTVVE